MTHHRRDQAARDGNRDPDVGTVMLEHAAFGPGGVGVRHALQRERERLDDEVVDRELVGGLTVLVLGCGGLDLLARGEELAIVAVEREIEMRDGELRFDQPARDHLADIVVRDDVVAARLEQRANLVIGWHRQRERCCRSRREALAGSRCLDIARDDAAMRTGAPDATELDAGGLGETARERRGKDAIYTMRRWRGCRRGRRCGRGDRSRSGLGPGGWPNWCLGLY